MNQLLSFLKILPEYTILLEAIAAGEVAAVTGIGQINRTHIISALRGDVCRPVVVICQDELAGKRL